MQTAMTQKAAKQVTVKSEHTPEAIIEPSSLLAKPGLK